MEGWENEKNFAGRDEKREAIRETIRKTKIFPQKIINDYTSTRIAIAS